MHLGDLRFPFRNCPNHFASDIRIILINLTEFSSWCLRLLFRKHVDKRASSFNFNINIIFIFVRSADEYDEKKASLWSLKWKLKSITYQEFETSSLVLALKVQCKTMSMVLLIEEFSGYEDWIFLAGYEGWRVYCNVIWR